MNDYKKGKSTMKTVALVEAAAQLRVGYHTAHRLVLQGKLRGERLHGHWYVDHVDLRRLLRERQLEREKRAT